MVCPIVILLSVFRMVVIPAQFEGLPFTCTSSELEERVAEAERYFNDQEDGTVQYSFTLAPVVTLPYDVSHYGTNYSDRKDVLLHEAVRLACSLSRQNVDFSLYDNDSDSEADNVFIIFAGPSEADGAGAQYIWPQHSSLEDNGGTLSVNGIMINKYSVCTELCSDAGADPRPAGIGTFCHEFAHYLGLPDLYDSDLGGSGGLSPGLYGTGLMDTGFTKEDGNCPPNFSAVDLDILGKGTCTMLAKGKVTLYPVNKGGTYMKLQNPEEENEYFLLECRNASGWDSLIGGSGLVIYHIDKSENDAGYSDYFKREVSARERWDNNEINCAPGFECAYPVTVADSEDGTGSIFLPEGGTTVFGQDSGASFTFHTGYRAPLVLHGIQLQEDGAVCFNVMEPIAVSYSAVYQDAAIVGWTIDDSILGKEEGYTVSWTDSETRGSLDLPSGSRSCTIEGLTPQTAYTVSISLKLDDVSYTVNTSLETRFRSNSTSPFIYLESGDGKRNSDGSFRYGAKIPLRLFNVSKAYSVEWFFNGRPVTTGADGFLTLTESGTLRAEISFEDSEHMCIIKEIYLK